MSKGIQIILISGAIISTCFAQTIKYYDYSSYTKHFNDIENIRDCHKDANNWAETTTDHVIVRAEAGVTYNIERCRDAGTAAVQPVIIKTDTDFRDATFIIDDSNLKPDKIADDLDEIKAHIFRVEPSEVSKEVTIAGTAVPAISPLTKNQPNISAFNGHSNLSAYDPRLVTVVDKTLNNFKRPPPNAEESYLTDVFIVHQNGDVDPATPILWNFSRDAEITERIMDDKQLTITGGTFETKANNYYDNKKAEYYLRNIQIERSNVVVNGLTHKVTGEGTGPKDGSPYQGFIHIQDCADVTIQNCVLSGHKAYEAYNSTPSDLVHMGSYDIEVERSVNVSFINCIQEDITGKSSIHDKTLWGIMASNESKNLLYDGCSLSRFDAHRGVYNATIKNSSLGHGGIRIIGKGLLLVDNCSIQADNLISLRGDYGSSWDGDFIIRSSLFKPVFNFIRLITYENDGSWSFGVYDCVMPTTVTIENLHIDTSLIIGQLYREYFVFQSEKSMSTSTASHYSYTPTEKVILRNITSNAGKVLIGSKEKCTSTTYGDKLEICPTNQNWTKPHAPDNCWDIFNTTTEIVNMFDIVPIVNYRVLYNNNYPPNCKITYPVDGELLTGFSITIDADATDPDGSVDDVEFFIDGASAGRILTAPYSITARRLVQGTYTLTAVATDDLGATTTSSPVTVRIGNPPACNITSPVNGVSINGSSITIDADATDTDGSITNVEFFVDGGSIGSIFTAPYSITARRLVPGTYTLTAVATDDFGLTTTSSPVTVSINNPPICTIVNPVTGTGFSVSSSITFTVDATDSDGSITSVEFFSNGASLGTDNSSPYTNVLSGLPVGTYVLTAIATDDNGLSTTSQPAAITVNSFKTEDITLTGFDATHSATYTIDNQGILFKINNPDYLHGLMFTVHNIGQNNNIEVEWFGVTDQNSSNCQNHTITLQGNGSQINNICTVKDASDNMFVRIKSLDSQTYPVELSLYNWQNGPGCP